MRTLVPAVVVILAACGPGRAPVAGGGNVTDRDQVSVPPAACPGITPGTTPSGGCDPTALTGTCSYAEGSCWCGPTPRCSGVPPREDDPVPPPTWQCTPTPPDVRPDGCPGVEQTGGAACPTEGLTCSWGACCITRLTCRDGAWVHDGGGCPP